MEITIQPSRPSDAEWLKDNASGHWGNTQIISLGKIHDILHSPTLISLENNEKSGFVSFVEKGDDIEIIANLSLKPGKGIGTALLKAVIGHARLKRKKQIILATTNDNLHAQEFYRRRGFRLARVYRNAMEAARQLKPQIPLVGENGIPIRDEILFAYPL